MRSKLFPFKADILFKRMGLQESKPEVIKVVSLVHPGVGESTITVCPLPLYTDGVMIEIEVDFWTVFKVHLTLLESWSF